MRRMCYQNEKINILGMIPLLVMYAFVILYFINEDVGKGEIKEYIGIIGILVFITLFYIIIFFRPVLKNIYKYKKIKREGIKYDGYITGYNYEKYFDIRTDKYVEQYRYTLNISYGKNSILKTPEISFNPVRDLGSRECAIYVLNNEAYATDFVRRGFSERIIWEEDDESVLYEKKEKEDYFEKYKISLLISAIFIVAVIALVIWQVSSLFIK